MPVSSQQASRKREAPYPTCREISGDDAPCICECRKSSFALVRDGAGSGYRARNAMFIAPPQNYRCERHHKIYFHSAERTARRTKVFDLSSCIDFRFSSQGFLYGFGHFFSLSISINIFFTTCSWKAGVCFSHCL